MASIWVKISHSENIMEEVWKDIDGFPGYQVSDHGRVRTHNKVTSSAKYPKRVWKDRILKQKIGKDKSCRLSLWRDGKETTVLVHRLVANEFLGRNIDTELTVNHKDGNRLNNNVSNLEWMTREDNIKYGFTHGQYAQKAQTIKDMNGNIMTIRSIAALGRFLGRSTVYINTCKRKNRPLYSASGEKYYLILGGET